MGTARDNRRLSTAELRAEVVNRRRIRMTFPEIGKQLGITKQRAWTIYQEALAAIPAAHVDEHRAEELMLVDDAIRGLLVIARTADSWRTRVEAWTSIRGWAERKAKLLGLDAPQKFEVLTLDQIDREIDLLNQQIAAADNASDSAVSTG